MKAERVVILLVSAMLVAAFAAGAENKLHWAYSGPEGPDHWAKLTLEYSACAGQNQSPVDLSGFIDADLETIEFDYQPGGNEILNNGHAVQVNYAPGSRIAVEGHTFALKQFHFHAPSENHINGRSFPMEGHLVHADEAGKLAVVAVMFTEGDANQILAAAWAEMPRIGEKRALPSLSAEGILPADRDYYRFNGSLTTPPCTEGVWWLVMKNPVSVSAEQVRQFSDAMGFPNNRPVQAINARPVLE
jgi:carbonic anhydrase